MTAGSYDDGQLGEVFLKLGKPRVNLGWGNGRFLHCD